MDEQSYCDHCLIVVGSGTAAEETLCKRRIAAGGRLAHLLTQGVEDHRISVRNFEGLDRCFLWQPPRGATSSFGKRLGPSFRTYWTKTGPDAVELEAQQQLVIFRAAGKMRHARILDEEGAVQAEMSGAGVRV